MSHYKIKLKYDHIQHKTPPSPVIGQSSIPVDCKVENVRVDHLAVGRLHDGGGDRRAVRRGRRHIDIVDRKVKNGNRELKLSE